MVNNEGVQMKEAKDSFSSLTGLKEIEADVMELFGYLN